MNHKKRQPGNQPRDLINLFVVYSPFCLRRDKWWPQALLGDRRMLVEVLGDRRRCWWMHLRGPFEFNLCLQRRGRRRRWRRWRRLLGQQRQLGWLYRRILGCCGWWRWRLHCCCVLRWRWCLDCCCVLRRRRRLGCRGRRRRRLCCGWWASGVVGCCRLRHRRLGCRGRRGKRLGCGCCVLRLRRWRRCLACGGHVLACNAVFWQSPFTGSGYFPNSHCLFYWSEHLRRPAWSWSPPRRSRKHILRLVARGRIALSECGGGHRNDA